MKRAIGLAVAALVLIPMTALAADQRFTAELTPDAEVPPISAPSEGSGSAVVTISDDGSEIAYEVEYSDLTGDPVGAHIHVGAVGVAGGVMFPLAHGPSPFSGTLTEADFVPVDGGPQTYDEALEAIRSGDAYINVHTEANPPGEIRGQLDELPDTSTAAAAAGGWDPIPTLLLVLAGLIAFAVTRRRLVGVSPASR